MSRRRVIEDADREVVTELVEKYNLDAKAIAEKFDCSTATVNRYFKKWQITVTPMGRKKRIILKEAQSFLGKEIDLQYIADVAECTIVHARKTLKDSGYTRFKKQTTKTMKAKGLMPNANKFLTMRL